MAKPVFRLEGVTKVYGDRTVLHIDSLEIEEGEILAIVGPSGAGKSTLLRLLNFLEPATTGTVEYLGVPVSDGRAATLEMRRQITTVFQRPVLLNRSVRANVAYGLKLRGLPTGKEAVHEALTMVGLHSMGKQAANTLSGGEAQRVALARALVINPRVLLLDEPTANLDPYNVSLIEESTRHLNEVQRTTIVMVTHNVFQAKRLADRVALMLNGRIIEVAPARAFFDSPRDPRTQAFLNGEFIY